MWPTKDTRYSFFYKKMVTIIQVCVVCGGKFKNIKILLSDGFLC